MNKTYDDGTTVQVDENTVSIWIVGRKLTVSNVDYYYGPAYECKSAEEVSDLYHENFKHLNA
jgi:hypothetical protein